MKRRVFIKKSSFLFLGGMISSCGLAKGGEQSLSKSRIKKKFVAELVRKPKFANDDAFDPEIFGWDKNLVKDLGFDSLDTVEFVIKLEKMYGISIKDEDAEKIKTPNDGLEMVYKYLKAGRATSNE